MVAKHRRHVLGPHLLVGGLGGRDRRGVLAQQVRDHQRHEQCPVGRDDRRMYRRRQGCLEGGRRQPGLGGRLLGLRRRRAQPAQIGGGRSRHRRRRRAQPRGTCQPRRHRRKRGRGRTQFVGQSIPSGRRVQHRRQPGTHVQARRIDLRGQHREAHLASLTGTADHHRVVGGAKRPVPRLGVLTVTIIQQTPDAGLALECRDRKSQLGLAGQ